MISQTLPSQRLRGFLRQGDAGTDRQGVGLEHGTLSADWRINDWLGAELVLGKHGSDAAHVESAWVQLRQDADDGGRCDRLMPCAHRARPSR